MPASDLHKRAENDGSDGSVPGLHTSLLSDAQQIGGARPRYRKAVLKANSNTNAGSPRLNRHDDPDSASSFAESAAQTLAAASAATSPRSGCASPAALAPQPTSAPRHPMSTERCASPGVSSHLANRAFRHASGPQHAAPLRRMSVQRNTLDCTFAAGMRPESPRPPCGITAAPGLPSRMGAAGAAINVTSVNLGFAAAVAGSHLQAAAVTGSDDRGRGVSTGPVGAAQLARSGSRGRVKPRRVRQNTQARASICCRASSAVNSFGTCFRCINAT